MTIWSHRDFALKLGTFAGTWDMENKIPFGEQVSIMAPHGTANVLFC